MLLELKQVGKSYAAVADAAPVQVLRAVNLTLEAGQSLAVIGPSGSGKSTLLNIIGTLDRPTTGSVTLDGRDLTALNDTDLAALRNEQIGWVFQAHHLLPQLSVLENVLLPTLARRARATASMGDDALARAYRLLQRVGLKDRVQHRPGQLSGGERQRVAVVRALINQPRLVLADEPTGALDRHAADNLAQLLVELNREEGVTLIVVTHALDLAGRMQEQRELRDGVLAAAGRAGAAS